MKLLSLFKRSRSSQRSDNLAVVGWSTVFRYVAIIGLGLTAFYISPWGDVTEGYLSRKIEFRIRSLLGRDPELDPRLVILTYDDIAVQKFQRPYMTSEQWVNALRLIKSSNPSAIFLDYVFRIPIENPETRENFKKVVSEGAPVIAGAWTLNEQFSSLEMLNIEKAAYSLRSFINPENPGQAELSAVSWLETRGGFPYGPSAEIQPAFSFIGSLEFYGNMHVLPFYRLSEEKVLPLAAFGLADSIGLSSGGIEINNTTVRTDRNEFLVLNMPHPKKIEPAVRSITRLLEVSSQPNVGPLTSIDAGKIFVILAPTFTGANDFKETAFGQTPGGYVHVSLINSILTNNWLNPVPAGFLIIPLVCLLGGAIGLFFSTVVSVPAVVASTLLVAATGLGLFVYANLITPWLFSSFGLFFTGSLVVAHRARISERKVRSIGSALEGLVAPRVLDTLFKNPEALKMDPSEHVVTVMFVDIVGFSLAAESLTPQQVFHYLKDQLNQMAALIHRFGGIIDKTLGDGLLCFFGYSYDGAVDTRNHAQQALFCAQAIQRSIAKYCVDSKDRGVPVSAIRIGLNSGAVYLGNMGTDARIDFTIIGHTVNYAKRLEEACESFRVMIGPATRDMLVGMPSIESGMRRRDLHIKHHAELIEAFEFDPFVDDPNLLRTAIQVCREAKKFERKETRWMVPENFPVRAQFPGLGGGELVDFSSSGFAVRTPSYIAKNVRISFYLDDAEGKFRARCTENELLPIDGEVRWGRPDGSAYLHGILIRNLNHHQRDLLLSHLRDIILQQAQARNEADSASETIEEPPVS